jgi:hypothetical protein
MSENFESELKKRLNTSFSEAKSNVVPFPTKKTINSGVGQSGNSIQQFGKCNYINIGDVNIIKSPKNIEVEDMPGHIYITESQAFQLSQLVKEIIGKGQKGPPKI